MRFAVWQALSSLSSEETTVETDTKGQRKTREKKKGKVTREKKRRKGKKAERRVKSNALQAVINTDGEADNPLLLSNWSRCDKD